MITIRVMSPCVSRDERVKEIMKDDDGVCAECAGDRATGEGRLAMAVREGARVERLGERRSRARERERERESVNEGKETDDAR